MGSNKVDKRCGGDKPAITGGCNNGEEAARAAGGKATHIMAR